MPDKKTRWTFLIRGFDGDQIGHGTYYPTGGNCQVYFEAYDYAAWQLADLGSVMLYHDVKSIEWEQSNV